ncbi:BQ5605_C002g01786 [Microbotryum silenes-dioicae]|uniref:BQ5605_C002g01786 protein n=1 Tax=Microbotryum silenes-dioicae TaxID=796604 RepID=A0A2X0LZR7_9BASI|nr:BQ5605_C002g01786 [Microbotryum silenes-dioicae]
MPKDTTDDVALSRRSLKAGVWYTVAKLAEEAEMDGIKCAVSEHFVAALTEFVFQKTLSLAKDLERFANHAGRTAIMIDDVKYEAICTEALQRGLGLKDLRTIARPVAARGSVTKRTASTKLASTSKAKPKVVATKGRVPAKAKVTASKVGGMKKGKEKERMRDSDDDEGESLGEEDSDDPRLQSRRGSSEEHEDEEEDDDDSLLDSDDSEPVKKKKKIVKKGSDGGSTKRKGQAKAEMVKKR